MMVVFPLLCLINVFFLQSEYQFNTYVRPIEALICIFLCLHYFLKDIESDTQEDWAKNSLNWINSGILIYFSSSLFIFICSNLANLNLSYEAEMVLWNVHNTFVFIMYLFLALGFSKCKNLPIISHF
jgi:hypothetical protein